MSTEVKVSVLPKCDYHNGEHDAEYDFRSDRNSPGRGSWGYGCQQAFDDYGVGRLGTGYGQKLIVETDGDEDFEDPEVIYPITFDSPESNPAGEVLE